MGIQKYFKDKAIAEERAVREEEQSLKRISSFLAREVTNFWSNVEKVLVLYFLLNTVKNF